MLTLHVNVSGNRILASDGTDAILPKFVNGDQVPLKLVFVDESFEQIAPPTSVTVALSRLGQKPTDGTFTLFYYGQGTAAIPFSATAAQLQTALNAHSLVTQDGGVTVSGSAGGPYSIVFNNPGARPDFTSDAGLLYPASQTIINVEVYGSQYVRERVTLQLVRNPAAYVDDFTTHGTGSTAYLTGTLNLATAGIESILGTSDLIQDAVFEVQTVTDGTQTTVQRRDVELIRDVISGAPTTPTPNSTFATLQQVVDVLAFDGDQLTINGEVYGPHLTGPQGEQGPQGVQGIPGVGAISTCTEVTASRSIADIDVGCYLYSTSTTGISITIPSGITVNNAEIDVMQAGTGQVTFVAGSGVTIVSKGGNLKLAAQGSGASLKKIGTSEVWHLVGDLTT